MLNICKDCEHFHPVDADFGVCRRYPPQQNGQFCESVYPKVENDLIACGEFSERKDPVPNKPNKPNNTNQRRKK